MNILPDSECFLLPLVCAYKENRTVDFKQPKVRINERGLTVYLRPNLLEGARGRLKPKTSKKDRLINGIYPMPCLSG